MPCFLIFINEKNLDNIRTIFNSNQLNGHHHFVIVDEKSVINESELLSSFSDEFTHVVYDSSAFSYSMILSLLVHNQRKNLQLGVYNAESRVLVTPEKNYV